MKAKLLPCPFCGNIDLNKDYKEKGYIISCFHCDTEQYTVCDEGQFYEAVESWNTRQPRAVNIDKIWDKISLAGQIVVEKGIIHYNICKQDLEEAVDENNE